MSLFIDFDRPDIKTAMLEVLLLLLTITNVLCDCPNGFFVHGSSCYKEFGIRATWAEAKVYCAAYGGNLAILDSAEEQNYIANYLMRLTPGSFNSGTFWLDGSDLQAEGEWQWSSQQKFSYTNWKPGQPDNAGFNENCLEMNFRDKMMWNDNNCNSKFNFLCEIQTNQVGSGILG